jgi:hypothetical protein
MGGLMGIFDRLLKPKISKLESHGDVEEFLTQMMAHGGLSSGAKKRIAERMTALGLDLA